ncbi:MAG: phytanoyl-CoA dioxygenase family protein [Dongiaceae bacterium]
MIELSRDQIEQFNEDGFLIVEKLIDLDDVERLLERYEPLFRGEFETGIEPDEWNWRAGRDAEDRTRQICNAWKADHTIASVSLRPDIGRATSTLMGWPGARVQVDNVLWKPAGAKSIAFHQDCSYLRWFTPLGMCSCWIALDDTTATGGTMELVRGSHKWGEFPVAKNFHAPSDYRADLTEAARKVGRQPEFVPVVVPKGGGSFHHGWTWHGSGPNTTGKPRRTLVSHTINSEVRYDRAHVGEGTGPWYGRYMRQDSDEMDENYFPILWTGDGRRTKWLDDYQAKARPAQTGTKSGDKRAA